jgi:hypothetical protein
MNLSPATCRHPMDPAIGTQESEVRILSPRAAQSPALGTSQASATKLLQGADTCSQIQQHSGHALKLTFHATGHHAF